MGFPKHGGLPQSKTPYSTHFEVVPVGTDEFDYAHHDNGAPGSANPPLTYAGMSGGPLIGISTTNNQSRVFGIHTRGNTNERAVRFSENVRGKMRAWIDQQ